MEPALIKTRVWVSKNWPFVILAILFSVLSLNNLKLYFRFELENILLLIVLPFTLNRNSNQKSIRYGLFSMLFFLLFLWLNISTLFFLAYASALFFLIETCYGKISSAPFVLVLVVSPIALFFSEVVGFEIRLWLTKGAVFFLNMLMPGYEATGNMVVKGENEFQVDAACMGLKMVTLGFFIALLLISYQQSKHKKTYNFWFVLLIVLISYVLTIFTNLLRIIGIILFNSPANTFSHELIGIGAFIVYTLIPLWFIINRIHPKTKALTKNTTNEKHSKLHINLIVPILLGFFVYSTSFNISEKKNTPQTECTLDYYNPTFKHESTKFGVQKHYNNDVLIYLKPPTKFFSADHTPLICWRGSGYKTVKEQMKIISGQTVYYNELKKEEDTIYSVWWYQSEDMVTTSQFKWRYLTLFKKQRFKLINVVSHSKSQLAQHTQNLLRLVSNQEHAQLNN